MRRPGLAPIRRGFIEMKQLQIAYSDRQGVTTVRRIEPQFIYLNVPVWYLLVWDDLRNDVRAFRIDRIHDVVVTDHAFRLRNREAFLRQAEQQVRLV